MPTFTGVSHIDLTVTDLDRSERFYAELFGLQRIYENRNDQYRFTARNLIHPETLLVIGLVQHDEQPDGPFDEHRCGLDHLSFNVASREELDEWAARLDARTIPASPIVEADMWDVLVFRDPDNIQLEFFFTKPEAAALVAGAAAQASVPAG